MLKFGGWSRLTWGRGPSGVRPCRWVCGAAAPAARRGTARRARDRPPCAVPGALRRQPALRPTAPCGAGCQTPRPPPRWGVGSVFWRDAQAGVPSAGWPRAQLAFKDSMVRGILQFTPGIAFRYVLHRCESRDIRCRESCGFNSFATRGAAGAGWPGRPRPRLGIVFLDAIGAVVLLRPPSGRLGLWPDGVRRPAAWVTRARSVLVGVTAMILPQVHLRKPCYDFSFL